MKIENSKYSDWPIPDSSEMKQGNEVYITIDQRPKPKFQLAPFYIHVPKRTSLTFKVYELRLDPLVTFKMGLLFRHDDHGQLSVCSTSNTQFPTGSRYY